VLTRQAHPGSGERAYENSAEKLQDSQVWKQYRDIPWPVLVDDLPGEVHQVYGGMADPIYLIDADGRVAYYNMWAHSPTMHRAIEALLKQGGTGAVNGGIDHVPHLLPVITDGWKGIRLGLPESYIDLVTATPMTGVAMPLGYLARPMLAPVTLRAKPLPPSAQIALGVAAAAVGFAIWRRVTDRPGSRSDSRMDTVRKTTTSVGHP
jgi:hypothetical protein